MRYIVNIAATAAGLEGADDAVAMAMTNVVCANLARSDERRESTASAQIGTPSRPELRFRLPALTPRGFPPHLPVTRFCDRSGKQAHLNSRPKVRFPLPEFTARVHGPS